VSSQLHTLAAFTQLDQKLVGPYRWSEHNEVKNVNAYDVNKTLAI
jgi:hypothetical protein